MPEVGATVIRMHHQAMHVARILVVGIDQVVPDRRVRPVSPARLDLKSPSGCLLDLMSPQLMNELSHVRDDDVVRDARRTAQARVVLNARASRRRCDWASLASRVADALGVPIRARIGRTRERVCAECA